jgi:hypothetical protein
VGSNGTDTVDAMLNEKFVSGVADLDFMTALCQSVLAK